MKRVFVARNSLEARNVKDLLDRAGIEAHIQIPIDLQGETLSYVRPQSEIIDKDSLPSVWIVDDTQLKAALDVVAKHVRGQLPL